MIGLGAGTIPYQMINVYDNIKVIALDTSNAMIEITKKLIPKNVLKKLRLLEIDGIKYFNKNIRYFENFYNLIILDAYVDDKIPSGFYREDFIKKVYKFLKEDGILAINFVKTPHNNINNMISVLKKYFKVYLLNTGYLSGNIIIVASKKEINFVELLKGLPEEVIQEVYFSYIAAKLQ